jgi:hypothetical protein
MDGLDANEFGAMRDDGRGQRARGSYGSKCEKARRAFLTDHPPLGLDRDLRI